MKIRPTSPATGLDRALQRHADASEQLQDAVAPVSPRDEVHLSEAALSHAPSAEDAVVEQISAEHTVEAAAAAVKAEEERQQALIFVLAHHGGPLR